jgi:hypothetical protein
MKGRYRRKPEITKKIATPMLRWARSRPGSEDPVAAPATAEWTTTTARTAIARVPSISGKRG